MNKFNKANQHKDKKKEEKKLGVGNKGKHTSSMEEFTRGSFDGVEEFKFNSVDDA